MRGVPRRPRAVAPLALLALVLAQGTPGRAHEAHDHGAAPPGAGAAPAENPAAWPTEPRFEAPAPGTYALPPIDTLGAHTLLDPRGEPAPLLALGPGQVAFVSFVYLSCTDACPAATATLQRLDREVAQDPRLAGRVRLVTVSFDPARDTPEAMGRFRDQLAHRGDWRFLTAAGPQAIAPVLEAFGQDATPLLAEGGDPTGALRHVLKVFLVDEARRVRNVYSSGFLDVRLLVNDALTVLGEDAGAR